MLLKKRLKTARNYSTKYSDNCCALIIFMPGFVNTGACLYNVQS